MIDFHKKFANLLLKSPDLEITSDFIALTYTDEANDELSSLGVETENIQGKTIRIEKRGLAIDVFEKVEDFLKINEIREDANILILNPAAAPLSYTNNSTYVNFEEQAQSYLFSNSIAYLEFLKFLKQQERYTEDAFHFIDYFNKDLRKIVLTSLSEKGRIIIQYKRGIPHFDASRDYSKPLQDFKDCFDKENKNLPKFLKASIISVASTFDAETRMEHLFTSLGNIITKAKINFEVYINNLSIDEIKRDYDEFKSQYFSTLSDILSQLTNKIIGLPIGISATIFAIEKVKTLPFVLIFLSVALFITSVYLSFLLKIHFKDLAYTAKVFLSDYQVLKENEFFRKFPEELETFEDIKKRIEDRIKFLRNLTESYFWILNVSNAIIIGYNINLLGGWEIGGLLIFSFILTIMAFIKSYMIIEK